jgi:hypothetical protein
MAPHDIRLFGSMMRADESFSQSACLDGHTFTIFFFSVLFPAELIQAGGNLSSSENRHFIHCVCNNEEFPQQ